MRIIQKISLIFVLVMSITTVRSQMPGSVPMRVWRVINKYPAILKVDTGQSFSGEQEKMRVEYVKLIRQNTILVDGKLTTTLTRRDLREAGLPTELYKVIKYIATAEQNNKTSKPRKINPLYEKYSFMLKPVDSLTEQQQNIKYKFGDLLIGARVVDNGKITILPITRRDFKRTGLPMEMYAIVRIEQRSNRKYLCKLNYATDDKLIESQLKTKAMFEVQSKAYWESVNKEK